MEIDEIGFARKSISTLSSAQSRIEQKYNERMRRTYHILQTYNQSIADQVFNQKRPKTYSKEEQAAIRLQSYFRGYSQRKIFHDMLYEKYEEEENKRREEEIRKMEEGILMMECIQLQQRIEEMEFLNRQKVIEKNYAATVIQRAWRKMKKLPTPLSSLPRMENFEVPPTQEIEMNHSLTLSPPVRTIIPTELEALNCSELLSNETIGFDSPRLLSVTQHIEVEEDLEPTVFLKQHNVSSEDCSPSELIASLDENRFRVEVEDSMRRLEITEPMNTMEEVRFEDGVNLEATNSFSMTRFMELVPKLQPHKEINFKEYIELYHNERTEDLPNLLTREEAEKHDREVLAIRAMQLHKAIDSKI
jgi:hypothetical protein